MFEKIIAEKNKMLVALSIIIIGVVCRIGFHQILPNTPHLYITINGVTQPMFMLDLFFVVAVVALLSGILLGGYYTFFVPISVMVITDLILGNTWILLFTWSGFATIGLIGYFLRKKNAFTLKKVPSILGAGIGSVLIYDLWTNFGCFLGWYPHTLEGLSMCFTVGLPFMFWHLLSTAAAIGLVIVPILYIKEHKFKDYTFTPKPFEKHIVIAVPAILGVIAILTLFV